MGQCACRKNIPASVSSPVLSKPLNSSPNRKQKNLASNQTKSNSQKNNQDQDHLKVLIGLLKEACERGDALKLKDLHSKGINLNCYLYQERKIRPIHIVVNKGHFKAIEYLLSAKVDINSQDSNYWTPLFIAANNGYFEILELLLENVLLNRKLM